MMGGVMVLASHAGSEILGAGRAMANAFAHGDRIGIIVLTDGDQADMLASTVNTRRMQDAADCQSGLQELLGEVPPLLMLSYPFTDLTEHGQPDLADNSVLGSFLISISAATLVVTDPGHSDPAYKAALKLASRIVAKGLTQQLVLVPLNETACDTVQADGRSLRPVQLVDS